MARCGGDNRLKGTRVILLPAAAPSFRSALALMSLALLAACGGGGAPQQMGPSGPPPHVVAMYQTVQDGEYTIPAVNPGYLVPQNVRQTVSYNGPDLPGTIVVDPHARVLYYVEEGGMATRYGIAVGREGRGFTGAAVISREAEWPRWQPTANMVRTDPEVYGPYRNGIEGGLDNPLGARALYLYRGGRDTYYRIHGTNNSSTIGRATSAGCIRLFNQDILDLYDRVPLGTPVKVRTLEESIALEGQMVEGPDGLMIPLASLPADVQNAIAMGQTPWPPFVAESSISPANSIGSAEGLAAAGLNDPAAVTVVPIN